MLSRISEKMSPCIIGLLEPGQLAGGISLNGHNTILKPQEGLIFIQLCFPSLKSFKAPISVHMYKL